MRSTLATYAADAARSKGRVFPQSPSATRSEFQRDRDRIVHSSAFRRLAHKTQVFISVEGDHFRTRLTHTIEVGQIARAIARSLALDEDLAEAVALAHDLGHSAFGHAGETALKECMAPFGGFDHNAQALRVVTLVERRYARHDGLNLAWETLEGIVKHNGPLAGEKARREAPAYVREYDARSALRLETFASLEAQAAAIADDIAYNAHDIDDGLRAGLFALDDIAGATPLVAAILDEVRRLYPGLETSRAIHEAQRRIITRFVEDAIYSSQARIRDAAIETIEDARAAPETLIAFSAELAEAERAIKRFLFARMYRHPQVVGLWEQARRVMSRQFPAYLETPALMPEEWAARVRGLDPSGRAQVVADYMAGMTDRFALSEHKRLFGSEAPLA